MRKTIPALTRRSDKAVQIGKDLKKIEKIYTSIAKIQSLRGTTVRVFSGRKFRWTEEAENEAQEAGVEPMELLWNRLADIVGYYCSQKAFGMLTQARGSEVRDEVVSALDKAESYLPALLVQIPYAGTKKEAEKLRKRFAARYRSQFPAAVETLERNWDRMVTFYDFPKEHWKHLRTTNVVESPFASVRLRTNAARRFKKVRNATALIWRTLKVAESRFRKLTAPHLLQQVYDQKHSTGPQVEAGKMAA